VPDLQRKEGKTGKGFAHWWEVGLAFRAKAEKDKGGKYGRVDERGNQSKSRTTHGRDAYLWGKRTSASQFRNGTSEEKKQEVEEVILIERKRTEKVEVARVPIKRRIKGRSSSWLVERGLAVTEKKAGTLKP